MPDNKIYDLTQLEKIAQNNQEFINEMLKTFCNDAPGIVDKMINYVNKKQYESLHRESHKFIPGVSFLGVATIKANLETIEEYAKSNNKLEELPKLVMKIKSDIDELIDCFKKDFNL